MQQSCMQWWCMQQGCMRLGDGRRLGIHIRVSFSFQEWPAARCILGVFLLVAPCVRHVLCGLLCGYNDFLWIG